MKNRPVKIDALSSAAFGLPLCTLLLLAALQAAAATNNSQPETPVLREGAYRLTLEEVVVQARKPYWRQPPKPKYEKKPLEVEDTSQPRLQWAPRYTREERDDNPQVQDRLNPQPRTKIFELKF